MEEMVKIIKALSENKVDAKLIAITAMCNYLLTCKYDSDKDACYTMINKILNV